MAPTLVYVSSLIPMFDIFVSPHTLAIEGIVIINACAYLRVSYDYNYMLNPTHVSLTNRYWSLSRLYLVEVVV